MPSAPTIADVYNDWYRYVEVWPTALPDLDDERDDDWDDDEEWENAA